MSSIESPLSQLTLIKKLKKKIIIFCSINDFLYWVSSDTKLQTKIIVKIITKGG
jgi:hypothetical protein